VSERTLLIVAHLPHASPRIPGLVKYLPEFGWRAIIVCPRLHAGLGPTVRVIETPHPPVLGFWKRMLGIDPEEGVRLQVRNRLGIASSTSSLDRLLGLAAQVVNYPDAHRRWRRVAGRAIEGLLKQEGIAAVLSTSPPVTAHVIARDVKARYGVPWIADLRDLWTQNHDYGYGAIRKAVDLRLERKTLGSADALVTVSQPWAERLGALHPAKRVHIITNGFDPGYVSGGGEQLPEKFTITYTGSIYPSNQDPRKLFLAVRSLIDDGTIDPQRLEVRFHTPPAAWLDREIRDLGLEDVVTQPGMVPYETALKLQRSSHALLLLNWEDPRERGWYPLKSFEYLAARRPIVAIGGTGDDVVTDLLNEMKAGRSCPNVGAIQEYLRELYQEYRERGVVGYSGLERSIGKFSYWEMARQFAEALELVIEKTPGVQTFPVRP
jgi:hypothetical protein